MIRLFFVLLIAVASFLQAKPSLPQTPVYPVVILGGGTGALTSALYLSRAGVQPLVIEGANPGGLITQSHAVQNWPGEMEISGGDLAEKLRSQGEANGVQFREEEVIAVDFSKRPFLITLRSLADSSVRQIKAQSCIIAMGTKSNYLGVPGESGPSGYWGRGVSNCAVCDGSLYRDKTVAVVGGGDAAILEGLYLSNIASQVNLFVRGSAFKGVEEKRLQTLLQKPNVKVFYQTTVQSIEGDRSTVTGLSLKNSERTFQLPTDAVFLAIGSKPNTQIFQKALKLDPQGYIVLTQDQQTSVEGVYAVGDIVDPVYKQAISAAGDGAKAAMQAQKFLSDRAVGLSAVKEEEKELVVSAREVVEISSFEQFQEELKNTDIPIVVDFYASWCGPCKRISPLLEQSAGNLSGKVKFLKVNVDQLQGISRSYKITSMPTVLLFDPSGSVLERKVGTDEISDLLKRLSYTN